MSWLGVSPNTRRAGTVNLAEKPVFFPHSIPSQPSSTHRVTAAPPLAGTVLESRESMWLSRGQGGLGRIPNN